MEIEAKETIYNGYKFRSRLEARWAVFFDAAKIKYEYEPEGFTSKDGTPYLPDFYLPDYDIYVEVKPKRPGAAEELEKAITVMLDNRKVLIVLPVVPYYEKSNVWWFPVYYYHPLCGRSGCRMTFLPFGEEGNHYLSVVTAYADGIKQRIFPFIKNIEKDLKAVNDIELDPPIVELTDPETGETIYSSEPMYSIHEAFNEPFLDYCYMVARQARFEHGETPKFKS